MTNAPTIYGDCTKSRDFSSNKNIKIYLTNYCVNGLTIGRIYENRDPVRQKPG